MLRMNCVVRSPLPELLERLAEVLEHLGVDDFDITGRGKECDQPRYAVHNQARLALAFVAVAGESFLLAEEACLLQAAGRLVRGDIEKKLLRLRREVAPLRS